MPLGFSVIDPVIFGRRLRGVRVMNGYETAEALARLEQLTGLKMSARTLLAIERGEQTATIDQAYAFILAWGVRGGFRFFTPALRGEFSELYEHLSRSDG